MLSGGLGSSQYVRARLEELLAQHNHPNAQGMVILPCNEPQLVVVRGLVLDNTTRVLESRIARMDYGVVLSQTFTVAEGKLIPQLTDAPVRKPNTYMATRQVTWLIQRGQKVSVDQPAKLLVDLWFKEDEFPVNKVLVHDFVYFADHSKLVGAADGEFWLTETVSSFLFLCRSCFAPW